MSSIFITATDTDAGKSHVTAALCRVLRANGVDVRALKPISCGHEPDALNADVAALLDAQGLQPSDVSAINLYHFAAYAAPLFAARAEGAGIDAEELVAWCEARAAGRALSLIEGVGGLMVPLSEGFLVCDWLDQLAGAKVMLVVRARLGGINQALLSIDKLQGMGRAPDWVLVNAADAEGSTMLDVHCEAIAPFIGPETSLLKLPYLPGAAEAAEYMRACGLLSMLDARL